MNIAQWWPAIVIVSAVLIAAPIIITHAWRNRDR